MIFFPMKNIETSPLITFINTKVLLYHDGQLKVEKETGEFEEK
jgi:hypothetical protein